MSVTSRGQAVWRGDLKRGSGEFTAGESLSGEYAAKARFEGGNGATPEQLIAGAHASCFSMALANILAEAGHEPESISTEATVTMDFVDGAPTITRIALETEGTVPGISAEHFASHATEAKDGCPVSRALAAVSEITVAARLA